MRLSAVLPLLLVPLLLSACGSDDQPASMGSGPAKIQLAKTDADIGKLIPADASVVLYVASPDGLARKMLELARKATPEEVEGITDDQAFDTMVQGMDMPPSFANNIDPTKPFAIAMTMAKRRGEPAPLPSFIMGVKDVDNARAEIQGEMRTEPLVLGSHVRVDPGRDRPNPSDTPAAIAKGLPEGDVVARVDLARLVKLFGPDLRQSIEEARAEMKRQMPPEAAGSAEIAGSIMDWAIGLIDSAEQMDLIANMDGKNMVVKALFTAKEGSALGSAPAPSGKLAEVAGCLPAGFPVAVIGSFPYAKLMEFIEPAMAQMTAAMPEESRTAFETYMSQSMEAMEHLEDEFALALDFGEEGMRMAWVMAASDAEAYLAKSASMLEDTELLKSAGMEFSAEPVRELAGCTVHTWRMKFDMGMFMPEGQPGGEEARQIAEAMMEGMFGPDGMTVHGAAAGGKVVMLMGGDEASLTTALEAAKAGGEPSGILGEAFALAGGSPKFLMQADLRAILTKGIAMARRIMPEGAPDEMPEVADGDAVPINLFYSSEGRHYLFGATLEVPAFMDLLMEMMQYVR